MDDLFNFDQFPEQNNNGNNMSMNLNALSNINNADSASAHLDAPDFFTDSFFDGTASNPYGLSDPYDTKCFDLQTTSGATNVSDGVIASEH